MPRKKLLAAICLLLTMLVLGSTAAAQEPAQDAQEVKDQTKVAPSAPQGAKSLVDDVMENIRQRFGFSLGIHGLYESKIFNGGPQQNASTAAAFSVRVYGNLGRRRSRFHFNYGLGYRFQANNVRTIDSSNHYGNVQYSLQLSRRTTLQISDQISSSPYAFGGFLQPVLGPGGPTQGFSTEVFLGRQRFTRNACAGTLSFATPKNHFSIISDYQFYRFRSVTDVNVHAVQLGATYERDITRWLSLSSGYSAYLNNVDARFRDARIHRLQVGGMNFKLGRNWQLSAVGGIELANTSGTNRWGGSANAQLSWHTRASTLVVTYDRGFNSAVGLARVLQSQTATLACGSRLTQWMNLQLSASYVRGAAFLDAGALRYYIAHAGLGFALSSNLVASLSCFYQNQHGQNLVAVPQTSAGYVGSVGLQYLFPGRRR